MSLSNWDGFGLLADVAQLCPVLLLILFYLAGMWRGRSKRAARKRGKGSVRSRIHSGFSASTFSVGLALQNLEKLMQPGVEHEIVQIYEEEADEDDQGDTHDPVVLLHRQLRRIRRGEPVERLTVPMK